MEKMTKAERATQFAPFAALRGYYDQIRKEEFIKSEKRDRTEEELFELNRIILEIKKGDMVRVKYFCQDGFIIKEGVLTEIDTVLKKLVIVKEKIDFSEIYQIEKE